jgi:acyl-CoA synthetase (AMP-forming)/AMP-acid ligase II
MKVEAGLLSRLPAERFGADIALSYNGTTVSFAELNEAACRIGSGLLDLGLRRGDRVGVLSYNRPELVQAWLGLEKHGLVRAVLHSHLDAEVHAHSMNQIGASALIFDTRFAQAIEAHRRELAATRVFVAIGPDAPDWATPFESLLRDGSAAEPYLDVDEDAACLLQLTSGTTGIPKPWVKTHRSWRAVIEHNVRHLDTFGPDLPPVGRRDVNLHFHPLQWASGFQTLYPYLLRGARSVLLDDQAFDPDALLDAIAREGATGMVMPGPLLDPVLDAVEARGGLEHRLRRMVIYFATADLLRRTTELLGPIWAHGYGSSEQGAPMTRLLPVDLEGHPERIASVGRASSPFVDVAVLDPGTGRRLGPGEPGEIAARSAMSIGSYWGLEEATRAATFGRDWFRPHDLGYLDDDGFLYYADRAGDEITVEGVVVYPHYVEAEILRHPAVRNCGVVGLGSDGSPEVAAAVQLKDPEDACEALGAEIRASCSAGGVRPPDLLVFVDELPTVLGGAKVRRRALREQLLEGARTPA